MVRLTVIVFLISPLLIANGPLDKDAALRMVKDRNALVLKSILDGDAQTYASFFCSDGFKLNPGTPKVKGKINIFQSQKSIFEAVKVVDGKIDTLDLDVSGDLIWETGRFEYKLQAHDGSGVPRTVSGNYFVVWKRQPDGAWLIQADVGLPD